MKNFVQEGDVLDLVAPTGGVTAGILYVIGIMAVVAAIDALAGETFTGATEGVFTLDKNSADTFVQGAVCYWDATNLRLTSTATGNTPVGFAAAAAGSGDTSMKLVLAQIAGLTVA